MRARPDQTKQRSRLVAAVAVVLALVVVGALLLRPADDGQEPLAPGTRAVPSDIAADCSADVQRPLSAFINGLPRGARIRFPAGACYAQSASIEVRDKSDLTIDGNGATFRSSAENTGARAVPNWLLLRDRNVRMTRMKIVGNFRLAGKRSQQRVNQIATEGEAGATSQPNAGVSVYGGDGVHLSHLDIRGVFGDGVLTAVSGYVDQGAPSQTPRDVHVEHVTVTKTARHCYSPNQVDGFWLEDSSGQDCWYAALDAELDTGDQLLRDVHILRNTFSDFNMLGIFVPVAGDGGSTRDVEIRDNRFLTFIDQPCNPIIAVGAYPTNPKTFKNVVVEDNTVKAKGIAVQLDHVDGGRVRGNRITFEDAGCGHPDKPPPVQVTNSTGVTVSGNGP